MEMSDNGDLIETVPLPLNTSVRSIMEKGTQEHRMSSTQTPKRGTLTVSQLVRKVSKLHCDGQKNKLAGSNNQEEKRKIEVAFPWLKTFGEYCRLRVGLENCKGMQSLLSIYLKHVAIDVKNCYMKPNRAAKLKKAMAEALIFFHLFYQDVKETMEHAFYLSNMTDLLSMYLDMEVKAARRRKETTKKVASRLSSSLFIFLDHSEIHMLDAILKTRLFISANREICSPVIGKLVLNIKYSPMHEFLYVRCILLFKLWKKMTKDSEHKKRITKLAVEKLAVATNFLEKSKFVGEVLPRIPKSKKDITLFFMQAKFNLKNSCKAFVKVCKESQSINDKKAMFFGDLGLGGDSPSLGGIQADVGKERNSNLLNDIWSKISIVSERESKTRTEDKEKRNNVANKKKSLQKNSKKAKKDKKKKKDKNKIVSSDTTSVLTAAREKLIAELEAECKEKEKEEKGDIEIEEIKEKTEEKEEKKDNEQENRANEKETAVAVASSVQEEPMVTDVVIKTETDDTIAVAEVTRDERALGLNQVNAINSVCEVPNIEIKPMPLDDLEVDDSEPPALIAKPVDWEYIDVVEHEHHCTESRATESGGVRCDTVVEVVPISEPNDRLCQGAPISEPNDRLCQGAPISEPNDRLRQGAAMSEPNDRLRQGAAMSEPNDRFCQGVPVCEPNVRAWEDTVLNQVPCDSIVVPIVSADSLVGESVIVQPSSSTILLDCLNNASQNKSLPTATVVVNEAVPSNQYAQESIVSTDVVASEAGPPEVETSQSPNIARVVPPQEEVVVSNACVSSIKFEGPIQQVQGIPIPDEGSGGADNDLLYTRMLDYDSDVEILCDLGQRPRVNPEELVVRNELPRDNSMFVTEHSDLLMEALGGVLPVSSMELDSRVLCSEDNVESPFLCGGEEGTELESPSIEPINENDKRSLENMLSNIRNKDAGFLAQFGSEWLNSGSENKMLYNHCDDYMFSGSNRSQYTSILPVQENTLATNFMDDDEYERNVITDDDAESAYGYSSSTPSSPRAGGIHNYSHERLLHSSSSNLSESPPSLKNIYAKNGNHYRKYPSDRVCRDLSDHPRVGIKVPAPLLPTCSEDSAMSSVTSRLSVNKPTERSMYADSRKGNRTSRVNASGLMQTNIIPDVVRDAHKATERSVKGYSSQAVHQKTPRGTISAESGNSCVGKSVQSNMQGVMYHGIPPPPPYHYIPAPSSVSQTFNGQTLCTCSNCYFALLSYLSIQYTNLQKKKDDEILRNIEASLSEEYKSREVKNEEEEEDSESNVKANLDTSLPLKKRLKLLTDIEEKKEKTDKKVINSSQENLPSYPRERMISIAELQLDKTGINKVQHGIKPIIPPVPSIHKYPQYIHPNRYYVNPVQHQQQSRESYYKQLYENQTQPCEQYTFKKPLPPKHGLVCKVERQEMISPNAVRPEMNGLPIVRQDINGMAIGRPEVNSRPIERTEINNIPMERTEISSMHVGRPEVSSMLVGRTEICSMPVGRAEISTKPIGRPEVNSMPTERTEINSIPVGRTEINSIPAGRTEIISMPAERTEINTMSVGRQEMNSIPMGRPEINSTPLGRSEMDGMPAGRSEINGMSTYSQTGLDLNHKEKYNGVSSNEDTGYSNMYTNIKTRYRSAGYSGKVSSQSAPVVSQSSSTTTSSTSRRKSCKNVSQPNINIPVQPSSSLDLSSKDDALDLSNSSNINTRTRGSRRRRNEPEEAKPRYPTKRTRRSTVIKEPNIPR